MPAVCQISKRYSGRRACSRQKRTCVIFEADSIQNFKSNFCTGQDHPQCHITLPRKTSTGEALERACRRSTLEELQDVKCQSCSLV